MNPLTIPQPPNTAWMPPVDPNDQDTLEQEQAMIEEEFKNILTQDMMNGMGGFEAREEDEEDEEDDDGDEMDEYTDEAQMPGEQEL